MPQESIDRAVRRTPSDCNIMVAIFWAKLGTPVVKSDGTRFDSGTASEIDEAVRAVPDRGKPLLLR